VSARQQPGDDAPLDDTPLDPELLEILVCPDCKTTVVQEGAWLVCQNPDCAKRYPIRDGIPVMLVDEAIDPRKRRET
jgi:uncharacterized protein YbaR (Trm112 family)